MNDSTEQKQDNLHDKPQAATVGYELLQTTYPYRDRFIKLRRDRIRMNGGQEGEKGEERDYAYDERPGAVVVVPVTAQGEMVLIRQYRYPVDDWCLEVPAGGLHDTGDASLEEVARKELKEEIGATCARLHRVAGLYSSPALSSETCHVFLALGVEMNDAPQTEATEHIDIVRLPLAEALHRARTGQVKTGPCALAILLCEPLLREMGAVEGCY